MILHPSRAFWQTKNWFREENVAHNSVLPIIVSAVEVVVVAVSVICLGTPVRVVLLAIVLVLANDVEARYLGSSRGPLGPSQDAYRLQDFH